MTPRAGDNRLKHLSAEIKKRDRRVRDSIEDATRAAMGAGDLLLEAKEIVGHGKFGLWLKENVKISGRTARLYMTLAKHRERLEDKVATVASLTLREAERLVAGRGQRPKAPRLLPPPGHVRYGKRLHPEFEEEIYVLPATLPGYFFVTRLFRFGPKDHKWKCEATRRPVPARCLDAQERILGTALVDFDFSTKPCDPQDRNIFLEAEAA